MKLDVVIDHTKGPGMEAFGIDKKRADEVQQFVDGLFEEMLSEEGITKPMVIQRVIEFSNSNVEACLIYGFIEKRYTEENRIHGLFEQLESLKQMVKQH